MNLFLDTSVLSLAWRRNGQVENPQVERLAQALDFGEEVFSTGVVLQELLQGFQGPRARDAIVERFEAIPLIVPERRDHIAAAELRNRCRRVGVQIGTIDALLAQICIYRGLVMLSTDQDFVRVAAESKLRLWS